mgnify:CR=1 FL=1
MSFSETDKSKIRSAFLTYVALNSKGVTLSEFCSFFNKYNFGLHRKGITPAQVSKLITRDCFLENNLEKKVENRNKKKYYLKG